MSRRRTVNTERLRQALREKGGNAIADTSSDTGVSLSWLQKAHAGANEHEPRETTMNLLSDYFGIPKDALFPVAAGEGDSSEEAS